MQDEARRGAVGLVTARAGRGRARLPPYLWAVINEVAAALVLADRERPVKPRLPWFRSWWRWCFGRRGNRSK